ncbi:MAG: hypothetical protein J6B30_05770 [Muribaculaceae bacterium]|nr:hypothetical protein [Muribaculaceae bacterium]
MINCKYKKVFLFFVLLLLTGCKTIEYVPGETVTTKVDSIYINKVQVDSIFERDSIYINQYTYGDTVYRDKIKYIYRYRDKLRIDTLHHWHVDSVLVEQTRVIEVDKPPTKWQSFLHYLGIFALATIVVLLVIGILWLIRKIRPT